MLTLRRSCLIALVACAEALCCRPAAGADARYFPDDTELVLTVNVRQILDSELVKGDKEASDHITAVLKRLAGEHPALKALDEAGLDASRDLTGMTFVFPRGKPLKTGLLVLEGDFEARKLSAVLADVARAKPDALRITRAAGADVYEFGAPAGTGTCASFVNKSTLVAAATRGAVTDAVARADGSRKSGLAKELTALLATTDGKQSISLVATGAALSLLLEGAAVPKAEAAVAGLKAIDGLAGAVTLAREVQLQIAIYARDDETAKQLAGAGKNSLLTLRTFAEQEARKDKKLLPVVEVVKSLRLTSEGPVVFLRGQASLDVIEQLMTSLPDGPAGAGRPRPGR